MKNTLIKIILLLIVPFILIGCSNNSEENNMINNTKTNYVEKDKTEAIKKIMSENEYIIVDVRTPEEYEESHIKGAINIEYDKATYQPTKVYLKIKDSSGYVQQVKIEVSSSHSNSSVNEVTKNHIQKIIYENYGIQRENILIGEEP